MRNELMGHLVGPNMAQPVTNKNSAPPKPQNDVVLGWVGFPLIFPFSSMPLLSHLSHNFLSLGCLLILHSSSFSQSLDSYPSPQSPLSSTPLSHTVTIFNLTKLNHYHKATALVVIAYMVDRCVSIMQRISLHNESGKHIIFTISISQKFSRSHDANAVNVVWRIVTVVNVANGIK